MNWMISLLTLLASVCLGMASSYAFDNVKGAQLLIAHVNDVEVPVATPSPTPSVIAMPIWIDNDTLRYYLSNVDVSAPAQGVINQILDETNGASLIAVPGGSSLMVYFKEDFSVALKTREAASEWSLYSLTLPKVMSMNVSMNDGVMTLNGLDNGSDRLFADVKIPVLSDRIRIRYIQIDLNAGRAHVDAGLEGDVFTIVADATINPGTFKIDIWQSVAANFDWFTQPSLQFQMQ